jgi:hypothetical protein
MRVQCAYCSIIYDLKEPFDDDSVSHGICPECYPGVIKNIEIELKELEVNKMDWLYLRYIPTDDSKYNHSHAGRLVTDEGYDANPNWPYFKSEEEANQYLIENDIRASIR